MRVLCRHLDRLFLGFEVARSREIIISPKESGTVRGVSGSTRTVPNVIGRLVIISMRNTYYYKNIRDYVQVPMLSVIYQAVPSLVTSSMEY